MQLYGSFLSPYTRRVYIALKHYGIDFTFHPKMALPDEAEIRRNNPLGRLPYLVKDDGSTLIDSVAILDMLEEQVGEEVAMLPKRGAARQLVLQVTSLGLGVCDKALTRFYEQDRRPEAYRWEGARTRAAWQIRDGLMAIAAYYDAGQPWLGGDRLSLADVMSLVALNFVQARNADLFESEAFPEGVPAALQALDAKLSQLPYVAESDPRRG